MPGFTRRYGCNLLVWYEIADSWEGARQREKQIKEWQRSCKVEVIETSNPDWRDLYHQIALP